MQERRAVVAALTAKRRLGGPRTVIATVAIAVVAADQISKTWALHHLKGGPRHLAGPANLILTFNSGAAFSLGRGVTPIVETIVVILVVWLVAISRRASRGASLVTAIGLGLLLGGALGNLTDRVLRHIPHQPGGVIDFVQIVSWWPVFNLADAAIVIGVILLALGYLEAGSAGG